MDGTSAENVGTDVRCSGALLPGDGSGTALRGWLVPPDADGTSFIEGPDEVVLDVEGCGFFVVEADGAACGAGVPPGARGFAWDGAGALTSGGPWRVGAYHLRSGRELAGSPLLLPGGPGAASAEPLSRWPRGLAGHAGAAGPVEVAEGFWAALDAPAASFRYELAFDPEAGPGAVPGRVVRLVAEVPAGRIAVHARPVGGMPAPGVVASVTWRAWLPEATSRGMQVPVELWLTRRAEGRFVPLRRLRRARLFRRPCATVADFTLTEEEAGGGVLVSLVAPGAKGLVAAAPRTGAAAERGARLEDARLEGSFEALRGMMRLTGGAASLPPLLPSPAPPRPEATLPAEPLGAAHPPTAVVVPVHNGDLVVRDCLRALKSAATGPMQVLIVDDGSRAFTAELLREEVRGDARFALHRRDANRGYVKSVNEGVLLTRAPWTVILNSDTLVTRGWLDRLHAAARAREGTGLVGPLSNAATWQSIPAAKRPDGSWAENEAIGPGHRERVQALLEEVSDRAYPEFPLLNGFCTLVAAAVFDRVGLLDEDAFPVGYGEENDLCLRARAAGFRLTVADDCFVYHHKSVSFGSASRARLARAGNLEFTNKHPGANVAALEAMMAGNPAMARLRARLADRLGDQG